jgi:acyl-CoA dehydrogenase
MAIFPWGRRSHGPGDALGREVAGILLEPSPMRDRLAAGAFMPMDPREPVGRMEDALRKVIAAEPVERKLAAAVARGLLVPGTDACLLAAGLQAGVITVAEGEGFRQAMEARSEAIRVDDFPFLGHATAHERGKGLDGDGLA